MVNLFRKLLIRIGKVIPFVLAFIVVIGYAENFYALVDNNYGFYSDGDVYLFTPISIFIGNIVYIDWFDVLLLYILAVALQFCKYNMRAVHYLLLNLAVRTPVEHVCLSDNILIPLCVFMALVGLYCVYGGFKMIPQQKDKF